ncbi:unnamed protein product [Ceratitis capitata]|uniref:(Mediterranean fruit fly) hypothetical protein n=1 Tax=Ceratitis capitata TaxID=7213 RepID=A0A811U6V8_CERCA|nr:unnamed protein product [Ceratitis capitata]
MQHTHRKQSIEYACKIQGEEVERRKESAFLGSCNEVVHYFAHATICCTHTTDVENDECVHSKWIMPKKCMTVCAPKHQSAGEEKISLHACNVLTVAQTRMPVGKCSKTHLVFTLIEINNFI